jgi:hypothetical protein
MEAKEERVIKEILYDKALVLGDVEMLAEEIPDCLVIAAEFQPHGLECPPGVHLAFEKFGEIIFGLIVHAVDFDVDIRVARQPNQRLADDLVIVKDIVRKMIGQILDCDDSDITGGWVGNHIFIFVGHG